MYHLILQLGIFRPVVGLIGYARLEVHEVHILYRSEEPTMGQMHVTKFGLVTCDKVHSL